MARTHSDMPDLPDAFSIETCSEGVTRARITKLFDSPFGEIWGFVGKKQRNSDADDRRAGLGDVWAFVAVDVESCMVPSYLVGKRDGYTADAFVGD